jgi:hypothetical protein
MSVAGRCILGFLIVVAVVGRATMDYFHVPPSNRDGNGSPRAAVDKFEWNFGRVPIGQDLRATFTVKNEGTRRLLLSDPSACCGSADSEIIIWPGQTKKLTLRIPTNQFPVGPGRKVVCYQTNDRFHPTLCFTMLFELTANETTRE